MSPAEKREALDKLLAAYTAERDAVYDSITDAEGNVLEEPDGEELARMDEIIDNARRALGIAAPKPQARNAVDSFLRGAA